ncbi:MAG TPA: nicotinic acid mononucleotide adenylyltransferase, partial [Methylophilaceae bacterium]|nr:nicotinic acid mononucleotide adenylyltransferase [Methylophilaceae bacterium]
RTLCLLLGADAFLGLPTWHRWQEILHHCHIVVAHRPNADMRPENFAASLKMLWDSCATSQPEHLREKRAGLILMQPITALDISATRIRQDLAQGDNPRYLLPDGVLDYIRAENLYR